MNGREFPNSKEECFTPRTLEQAFGPYARGPVHEPRRKIDWQDRVVLVACVLAALAILLMWAGSR